MKTPSCLRSLALLLALTAIPAAAQEQEMRTYINGGYVHILEDGRGSDDGQGVYLGIGSAYNQYIGFEYSAFYHEFDRDGAANPNSWREFGGKVDGMLFYSRNPAFSPYFGVGLGFTNNKITGGNEEADTLVDAGVGFFKYFTAPDLGLRVDLRSRWVELNSTPGFSSFTEPILRVGLVIPLGERPAAYSAMSTTDTTTTSTDTTTTTTDTTTTQTGSRDSDGDGVPDSSDKCPGTARGVAVDADGCPLTAATGPNRAFENVQFAFDKSDLTSYAQGSLDNTISTIKGLVRQYPSLKVDVSGHTDWIGTDGYNQALSERRVNAVMNYLKRNGVEANRINSFAFGEAKPIATNETDEGRTLNRRAEIRTRE